ncbi:helix-turn-helix domain-containing protein [Glaciimonas immobilis]|uniref:Transcriptional regulator with XRE-family HTH domain n=1 Tax=Glaciimonas immobilis TaxID=728004 RepID=A0A840RPN6_9BURK|nr:helix-turn-helix domain-containing protein [Glaciimonas immobilis]KAF3999425.1 helix-turn-helix domain-containing protein [Glaciimonas immobilis]MBB5198928.1 transcriptional regulator with XRE-family HTH domain [Glaciimonas immobilis]
MPKKFLNIDTLPTLVHERLITWGRCVHTQRLRQRITAADLCGRMSISEATLRRLEKGDPGTGAGAYLTALLILGVADEATPPLTPSLWADIPQHRVKLSRLERRSDDDI